MKRPRTGKRISRSAKSRVPGPVSVEPIESRLLMSAVAVMLTDIAQFTSSAGHQAASGVIRDASGNLFGTTTLGGTNNLGTVYKVANGSSTVTTVASFTANSGSLPTADLIMDSAGNLYGTTPFGGANGVGSVFKVSAGASTITNLASFTSSTNNAASVKLALDSHGNVFGITPFGGANNAGTIFEIVAGSGTLTTVASFSTATGDYPTSGLVADSAGNLYGTTPRDGADGFGSIYELPFNTSSITVLAPFTSTNSTEQASAPVIDSAGDLFGTTQSGGINGEGSIYQLSSGSSTIVTLASFNGSNGANPSSPPMLDSAGNLFGTTPNGGVSSDGTVWEMPAGSGTIATIAVFNGSNGSAGTDGYSHNAIMPGLIADGHGNYYGVAPSGASGGLGTVYSLTPQKASQIIVALQPTGNVTAGMSQTIQLNMETASNTIDATNTASVSLAIFTGPTGAALSGSVTTSAVSGVATLNGVIFSTAGTYTLKATSTGLTSAITAPITVVAGPASTLVISQQPTGAVAGLAIGNTIVEIEDGHGNVVTTDTSTVNVGVKTGIVLNGTTAVQAVAGVATISGLSINTAGSCMLALTDGSLASVNSSSFTITAAAASQLVVAQQPSATTAAGQSIGIVSVAVEDQFGNLVTSTSTTIALTTGTSLTGTASKVSAAGVANFSGLSITTAGTYTLSITGTGLVGTNSSSFIITAAAASKLYVIQQPQASTIAGQNIGIITVGFQDAFGNPLTTGSSTITASASAALIGTTSVVAVNGLSTFSTLSMDVAGTYTLTFNDGNLTPAASTSFVITPAGASQLIITQQPPATTVAGQTLGAMSVSVADSFGNIVTSDSSTMAVLIDSSATLSGTTSQAAQSGVATFADLTITAAGSYTITVTDGDLTSAISSSFNIIAAGASQLIITQQPTTATTGEPTTALLFQLEDVFGNLATADLSSVTVAANVTGILTGTSTQPVQIGLATFGDLSFTTAGIYTLTATDGSLTPITTEPIVVTAPPAPPPLPAVTAIAGAIIPKLVINTAATFGAAESKLRWLTVHIQSQSAGNAVVFTHVFPVRKGNATIFDFRIRKTGIFTLVISDAAGDTRTEQVTILPARAIRLEFVTQPASVEGTSPVQVKVVDAYGNQATSADGSVVNIRLGLLPDLGHKPTFTGTTAASLIDGLATFPDIAIAGRGRGRLLATAPHLRGVESNVFLNT